MIFKISIAIQLLENISSKKIMITLNIRLTITVSDYHSKIDTFPGMYVPINGKTYNNFRVI